MQNKHKLALLLTTSAIFLALAFNALLLWRTPGLSLPVYFVLVTVIVKYANDVKAGEVTKQAVEALYVPLFLVSLVPMFTQNAVLTWFSFLFVFISSIYVTVMSTWHIPISRFGYLGMAVLTFFHQMLGLGYFYKPVAELRGIRKGGEGLQLLKLAGKVVLGLLLALPLVVCFFLLFALADQAFSQVFTIDVFLENLFAPERIFEVVVLVVVGFWWLGYLGAAYYFDFKGDGLEVKGRLLDPIVSTVVSVVLNMLFLVFVIVQFVYMFAGEENIRELGVTYAEYARQGFFELVLAASLSLVVIYSLRRFGAFRSATNNIVLQLSLLSQVIFTLVILASAYMRMVLYQSAFDLTDIRFLVFVFLIFLVLVFTYLGISIFWQKGLENFSLVTFVLACLVIFVTGVVNPDASVARANIAGYQQGTSLVSTLDSTYLIEYLSSDAYSELLNVQEIIEDTDAMCRIAHRWKEEGEQRNDIRSLNLYRLLNRENVRLQLADYYNMDGDLIGECGFQR